MEEPLSSHAEETECTNAPVESQPLAGSSNSASTARQVVLDASPWWWAVPADFMSDDASLASTLVSEDEGLTFATTLLGDGVLAMPSMTFQDLNL